MQKNVRDARHRLWQSVPAFATLDDLNAWLEQRCQALWHEIEHGKLPGTVADVWAQERSALMPVPRAFDGFVEQPRETFACPEVGRYRLKEAAARNVTELETS